MNVELSSNWSKKYQISKAEGGQVQSRLDQVVIEEPLEIILNFKQGQKRIDFPLAVTMRTPGADEALVMGFLLTEGVIKKLADIERIQKIDNRKYGAENYILVRLDDSVKVETKQLERHFYTSSSCGVCGKTAIEPVFQKCEEVLINESLKVSTDLVSALPERAKSKQKAFKMTGGIHAAAAFNQEGVLLAIAEDVGRHNAMDKLIGKMLPENIDPSSVIIFLSGRASFELVQKCAMIGFPIICSVGAASNLAIDLAADMNMTLIGFVRKNTFNIYCGAYRVSTE